MRRPNPVAQAVTCAMMTLLAAPGVATAQQPPAQAPAQPAEAPAKLPPEKLDSLVAPIALYPDPLLAQALAASTYPLEIVQLQQWLAQNQGLEDQALVDAVSKQDWDPSVQGLAALPDVVKLLSQDIKWTTELGDAFLAQESEVMDAVQRMRGKASGSGNLKSTEQMKVETQQVEGKQVIVIEQASPEVVYVPSYNPTVVYGAAYPYYPYPAIAYPPVGYYAAGMALSFGVGVAMGAFFGGGWGYGAGWHGGGNNINVNRNNTFVNKSGGAGARGGNWQHNPQHRGGAPYGNRSTADRFGGSTRGDAAARRGGGERGGERGGDRGGARGGDRGGGLGGERGGDRGGSRGGDRGGGQLGGGQRGGSDRVGNRSVSSAQSRGGSRSSGGSAFSGGRSGYSGSSARMSSSRGSGSMGGRAGGGGRGGRR